MLASATAEVVSLGAVVPFLGVLTESESIIQSRIFGQALVFFNLKDATALALPITLAFVFVVVLACILRILLLWVSTRVAYSAGSDLCVELYKRTLYQPYEVHVNRNSSEILAGLTKAGGVVSILLQCTTIVSSIILVSAIGGALIVLNVKIAIACVLGFGIPYILVARLAQRKLLINSGRVAHSQSSLIKTAQEGLGGIRDVLLDGTQPAYFEAFKKHDNSLRQGQANNVIVAGSPRFVIEALAMILIASIAYGYTRDAGGFSASIPVLGAFALAAQRMLPALQQGYSAWASIMGFKKSLEDVVHLLDQPIADDSTGPLPTPLPFSTEIRFKDVGFQYPSAVSPAFRAINFSILKGERVGVIGATGSGKSTILDLLMGLLRPTSGEILIDGQALVGTRLRSWQMNIAHVPQQIFLSDGSFLENIALGSKPKDIDFERAKKAAEKAKISHHIESTEQGYLTRIGERGVRLSGGQRQRLGIARALYKNAQVIVFDEATSALDTDTEESVMSSLYGLSGDLTIILVAHRLSTLHKCTKLVEIRDGEVCVATTH